MAQFYQQAQYQAALDFKDFQNQMEQQKKDFIKAYKQNFPYASDDDADVAYTNYLLAVQNEMNGSNSNSSIDKSSTSHQETKSDQLNYHSCGLCHGSGKCQACDGTGIFKDKTFGTGSQGKKCKVCNGSGICPHCHGDKGYYRHY